MRIFFVLFLLAACGSDSDSKPVAEVEKPVGVAEVPEALASEPEVAEPGYPQSLYIAAGDELPACGDENERQLIYDADAAAFKHCAAGEWLVIEFPAAKDEPRVFVASNIAYLDNPACVSKVIDRITLTEQESGEFLVEVFVDAVKVFEKAVPFEVDSVIYPQVNVGGLVLKAVAVAEWKSRTIRIQANMAEAGTLPGQLQCYATSSAVLQ